jgi:hypothetical protein
MITWLLTPIVSADDSAAINKLISDINRAAKTNKPRILKLMVLNTDVAASTLEQETKRTGLSFGDVYVAHSLAMASHKSFNEIVAFRAGGQSWSKIAQTYKVSLKGSMASLQQMLNE